MQRKFIINLGLLLFLNLLIKPFWVFGIDRTVQNLIGSQEYGFYFAILNFSFLFNILLDLGITNFNNRNIAQHSQLLAKHFSGIVSLKLILGFLYFIVTISIGLIWGYRGDQLLLLAFVGFNQFLLSFLLYLRSNISGMLMFRTESFMSVLDRSLMIVIMSVLLWGNLTSNPFKIEWFVYAQTGAYTLAVIVAYMIVVIKSKSLSINWNIPFFLLILRKSMPFAILTLVMMFYYRIDTVLLNYILPGNIADIQVGIYAHAFRILEATNQISYLFAVLLLPAFSYLIHKKEQVSSLIKGAFSILFVATSILTVFSIFNSFEIMSLLYVDHIEESSNVYSVLIFGTVATGVSYVFGTLLTANGNLKELIYIAAFSVLISFVLNFLLTPSYLSLGSAIANMSALTFTAIAQIYISIKRFNFRIERSIIIRYSLFIIGILFLGYIGPMMAFSSLLFEVLMFAICSVFLALIVNVLDLKGLLNILKIHIKQT